MILQNWPDTDVRASPPTRSECQRRREQRLRAFLRGCKVGGEPAFLRPAAESERLAGVFFRGRKQRRRGGELTADRIHLQRGCGLQPDPQWAGSRAVEADFKRLKSRLISRTFLVPFQSFEHFKKLIYFGKTIIVTPSWDSQFQPRIQDISTHKIRFCRKADCQNGIRLSAFIRLFRRSAFQNPQL